MDKSWMKQSRATDAYDEGLTKFLDFAFENASCEGKISCPCKKCRLLLPVTREDAYDHLIVNGFMNDYTKWVFHGELESTTKSSNGSQSPKTSDMDIDMDGLLHDAFGFPNLQNDNTPEEQPNADSQEQPNANSEEQPHGEAKAFYDFVNDAKKELYPGCKSHTKLSFIIQLFHIKCLGGWSDNSFGKLLKLIKVVLPEGETLPDSFYEMKKIIKKLGLDYEKIHVCPNDCILYRKEFQDNIECPKCHLPRYVTLESSSCSPSSSSTKCSDVPAKILRYFPLIPRLQRLFMCSETASLMRWHDEKRTKDGYMRHPADSPAWMTFDYKNTDFSAEPRNVRLGLACDGMNPYKTMSTTYSIWPVILMAYNLPPWMCMDSNNLILSMIIPGPGSPGNNIDVYLQPLIDELKLLWEPGVPTFDISLKKNFQMRAALLWTISDLPALAYVSLAYVSGWSTRGRYGCISCHKETCSKWLKHGRKFCYMGHRRFLGKKHHFRNDEKSFDGGKEKGVAPLPLDGQMILSMLEGFEIEFGKTSVNPELPYNWKKRSILFELPYWKTNLIRHNLDVMHIEKNVCESIIGTLLNLEGKTKDGLNARLDLKIMGLKPELHPKQGPNGKTILPPACFSFKKEEKITFCDFLRNIRVPDGYASNISRCINFKEKKIYGLKSHDCHILMTQLLPLAVRGILSPTINSCLVDLSNFFRKIYSKVQKPEDLVHLERDISIILCKLEMIFPPAFFDIVVHLLVHLPREARLAGPVQYRHMYPVERDLCVLKSYVKSKSNPEGCIAEAFVVNECLTFCSRYMVGMETRLNRPSRNNDDGVMVENVLPIFSAPGRPLGKGKGKGKKKVKGKLKVLDDITRLKAHRYVLFNCPEVGPYIEQHLNIISQEYPHLSDWQRDTLHNDQFPSWFQKQVHVLPEALKTLADEPERVYRRYKKYLVNGFRFHTKEVGAKKKTQNSGVMVTAETRSFSSRRDNDPITSDITYYGVLTEILELDYSFGNRVVLFKCDWVSNRGKKREKDCMRVNFNYLMGDKEPFILASQAEQVMYLEDLKHKGCQIAIKIVPRDFYDMSPQSSIDDVESYLQSQVIESIDHEENNNFDLLRRDMQPLFVNAPLPQVQSEEDSENNGRTIDEEEDFDLLF